MNKQIEEHRRQQIFEILDLCLRINGLQKSNQKRTRNHPTAFFMFSGHVALVEVDVHEHGWDSEWDLRKEYRAYLDQPKKLEKLIQQLKKEIPEAATPRESVKKQYTPIIRRKEGENNGKSEN